MDTVKILGDDEEIEDVVMEDMEDGINHGIVVSNLAFLLAKELKREQDFCYEMAVAGMLHDIGKLKLCKYLYGRKKDTLVVEEMKYVRLHSKFSADILRKKDYSACVVQSVYHHHENFDGSGYPDNLKGSAIPYGARIIRTCDVFAALISDRPYRKAFDSESAMYLMIDEVKNFDMEIFLAFQRVLHSPKIEYVLQFVNNRNIYGQSLKQLQNNT